MPTGTHQPGAAVGRRGSTAAATTPDLIPEGERGDLEAAPELG
jgi:hypothetical protein